MVNVVFGCPLKGIIWFAILPCITMRKVYAIYLRCVLLGVEQSQQISLEVQSTLSICAEKSHFEPLLKVG